MIAKKLKICHAAVSNSLVRIDSMEHWFGKIFTEVNMRERANPPCLTLVVNPKSSLFFCHERTHLPQDMKNKYGNPFLVFALII